MPLFYLHDVVVVESDEKVVGECADESAHVGHQPGDPEEAVGRGEGILAPTGDQGEQAAERQLTVRLCNIE